MLILYGQPSEREPLLNPAGYKHQLHKKLSSLPDETRAHLWEPIKLWTDGCSVQSVMHEYIAEENCNSWQGKQVHELKIMISWGNWVIACGWAAVVQFHTNVPELFSPHGFTAACMVQKCFLVSLKMFSSHPHTRTKCFQWQKKRKKKCCETLPMFCHPLLHAILIPLRAGATSALWCDLWSDGKSSASAVSFNSAAILCHSLKGTKKRLLLHYLSAINIRGMGDCSFLAS